MCIFQTLFAQSSLLITQYYEGTSSNRYIEITNIGDTDHHFSSQPVWAYLFANASADNPSGVTASVGQALSGILPAGAVRLYKNGLSTTPAYAAAIGIGANFCSFTGDDLVILSTATNGLSVAGSAWNSRIDVVGDGSNWGADVAWCRNPNIAAPGTTFDLSEWTIESIPSVDNASEGENRYLGRHSMALPVELMAFSAEVSGAACALSFSTSSEEGSAFFVVERSTDGAHFTAVGQLEAQGNAHRYTFTDTAPVPGLNYYRLRMVDTDGVYRYSAVVAVRAAVQQRLEVLPNPVAEQLFLHFESPLPSNGRWEMVDLQGRLLQSGQLEAEQTAVVIRPEISWDGLAILRVVAGSVVWVKELQRSRE